MRRKYSTLYLGVLTPEQHAQTCNYWYVVTDSAMAHTAFETEQGLRRWLTERGLTIEGELGERGKFAWHRILGEYATECHFSPDAVEAFNRIAPLIETRTLSNGQYVVAKIDDRQGIRTVHTLNPNVRDRLTFDYFTSDKLMR